MKNPIQKWFNPSTHHKVPRHVFQIGLVRVLSDLAVLAFLAYETLHTPAWQLNWATLGLLLTVVVGSVGLGLIHRGRPLLGMWLIIANFWPITLLIVGLFAGLGLPLGVIVLLVTSFTAGQTLPQKQANGAILTSALVFGLMIGLDQMDPAYRLLVPDQFWTAILVVAGIITLIYTYFTIREFTNYSLRTKLVIAFLAVTLSSLGVLAFSNARSTRANLLNSTNQLLLSAASETATGIDTFVETNLDAVRVEAELPALVRFLNLPPEQQNRSSSEGADALSTLIALSHKDPVHISSYALLDTQGRNLLDTLLPDTGMNEADQDYFQTVLGTQRPYVSPVKFSVTTNSPFLYFSSPVLGADGSLIGILRVRYSAIVLQHLVSRNSDRLAGRDSFAILLDENQIRLGVGKDPNLLFQSIAPLDPATAAELQAIRRLPYGSLEEVSTNLPEFAAGLAGATTQPTFTAEAHPGAAEDDHPDLVAVKTLKTQPWQVAFVQPPEVYEAPVQSQIQESLLWTVWIALVVGIGAFVLGQYLAGPIIRLTAVAQRLAGGDLQAQAVVEAQDEIGQLADTFNQMTTQLRTLIGSLEEQIQARTAELILSMEVGQRAAAIRELEKLLPTITEFIRQQFNLYYTQVYFVDDLEQNLVLLAGTGEVGQELLARRHSLPLGGGSIVGLVASESRAIVVPDTRESNLHKPNPLLPKTRSELAVPLVVEGKVIGVLDMQATQPHTFTERNQTVFEAMATQLAISIDSARQWALAQEAQERSEQTLRQLTRETWAEVLTTRHKNLGFSYDLSVVKPFTTNGQNGDGVAVPVVVQNQPIGHLAVHPPEGRALSGDEHVLLSAIAQQLAQKAENIRLFEETQQRAAREQVARQITDKIRASRDIETALQTAAAELSKALGTAKTVVDLHVAEPDNPTTSKE